MKTIPLILILQGLLAAQGSPLVLQTFTGSFPSALVGSSVAYLGDVDGDGVTDIAFGAPLDVSGRGSVSIHSGATGAPLSQFSGNLTGPHFGIAVAPAGDVDADGVPDLIAGADFNSTLAPMGGAAFVYSGSTGALLHAFHGQTSSSQLGQAVAGVGDVDGDGHADVAVGVPLDDTSGLNAGEVRVYSGNTGSLLYAIQGGSPGARLGRSVAGLGDVDGDGVPDLVAGAPFEDGGPAMSGAAHVYSGATGALILSLPGDSTGQQFGRAVAAAGDVNGDGVDDILVGAPFETVSSMPQAGSLRIYSGVDGTLLRTIQGEGPNLRLGWSMSSILDVDADGFADILVGAPHDSPNGLTFAGSVRIYSSATGALLSQFVGFSAGAASGMSVAGRGDINGDGICDPLVGAPNETTLHGVASGVVRVYSGTFPPHLEPCAAGNVGAGTAGPSDVLVVNGSSGVPTRIVDVGIGQPFTIGVAQPPTNPFPADFALGAFIGLAGPSEVTTLPFGIGTSCLPATSGDPGYFILTNNFAPGSPQLMTSTPTPWATTHSGLPFPFTLTLQGVIRGTPAVVQVTNAVALRIQ
ncbi:MAG TPA: hypothetical protein ENK43_04795 [Planctomycetes bacterium]|nr:hypothetical protein [Planctomycetota bacterium]